MQEQTDVAGEQRVRASFSRQGLMKTLGAKLDLPSKGHCQISAPITRESSQQHGYAHAGLTFAIGDSAAGYAALSLLSEDQEVLTAEIKINLLAPGLGTHLLAEGRVIRAGRRLMTVESLIFAYDGNKRGRQVAQMLGTMMPIPISH